jgi:hypothetical protein
MKKVTLIFVQFLLVLLLIGFNAHAAPVVFERALPTDNLNNAAGFYRSNVTWGYNDSGDYSYYTGDDFILDGDKPWIIEDFTVWFTEEELSSATFDLWFGSENDSLLSVVSTTSLFTSIKYINGESYQGGSGKYYYLYELTFQGLGFVANNNQLYNFSVTSTLPNPLFLHASNKDLSGSTQDGADDLFKWFWSADDALSLYYGGTQDSNRNNPGGSGWDKSSDINVRITANPVPEPGTIALLGIGLAGLGFYGYRRRNKV